ncbi:MAG TPA: efflux RND transporter periplasmic adaptor subunit [Burkholderiales bacterium]|nr:efflux RND transporter periplasmic adaptor subunit [Burkholderiales bacterium]
MKNAFVVAALAALLAGCDGAANPQQQAVPPPPEVEVTAVAKQPVTVMQDLPGRLAATRTAQVRARVEGIVEKRLFKEGTDVKEGQILFQIDPRTMRAEVNANQAALARAKADVAQTTQTVERYRPLVADNAISKLDFDVAVARQKQAQADVAAAEAELAKARLDLGYTTVNAPISGRIGRELVTEGALVGKNEATHLATIEQIDPIYANFTQSSAELLNLRQAIEAGRLQAVGKQEAPITLLLEDGSVYPIKGKLIFSDLAVDPTTGVVSLRAEFSNPNRHLLPGMFVKVRIAQAERRDALAVPVRAVQTTPQGQQVLTVGADNKVVAKPIKTGELKGGDWIVTEGLTGEERVIVNGLQKAQPGAVVNPVALADTAPSAPTQAQGAAGPAAAAKNQ